MKTKNCILKDRGTGEIYSILIFEKEIDAKEIEDKIQEVFEKYPNCWSCDDIEENIINNFPVAEVIYIDECGRNIYYI